MLSVFVWVVKKFSRFSGFCLLKEFCFCFCFRISPKSFFSPGGVVGNPKKKKCVSLNIWNFVLICCPIGVESFLLMSADTNQMFDVGGGGGRAFGEKIVRILSWMFSHADAVLFRSKSNLIRGQSDIFFFFFFFFCVFAKSSLRKLFCKKLRHLFLFCFFFVPK